jgi:hypothetical protein
MSLKFLKLKRMRSRGEKKLEGRKVKIAFVVVKVRG